VREKSLFISKNLFEEIISHCREAHPNEACGILAGNGEEVFKVYKMSNIEKSSVSYFMDSMEQSAVQKDMRVNGISMLAIFHSHPSATAYPSMKDIELALWDGEPAHGDVVYIIISLSEKQPVVKGFLIGEGEIKEVGISVS